MIDKQFNICVGKTQENNDICLDIKKNLLVVDKHKQGQVSLFSNIIKGLQNNYNNEVRIVLIDYENKYYTDYIKNDLLTITFANNNSDVESILDFIKKMQKFRASLFKACNINNIEEYNKKEVNKIPYIFILVDEVSYLIDNELIDKLLSLTNLSRCTGINILVGTSLLDKSKTLSGKIKATFINRICFSVDLKEESKLALDEYGAEHLNIGQFIMTDNSTFLD